MMLYLLIKALFENEAISQTQCQPIQQLINFGHPNEPQSINITHQIQPQIINLFPSYRQSFVYSDYTNCFSTFNFKY
jgi:hypothetical protein